MGNIKLRFIASILGIVGGIIAILGSAIYGNRSEERRVGKECT